MGNKQWTPQRTRCGLSLWTYSADGSNKHVFAMIVRDSDGARVTRPSFTRTRVAPGRMPDMLAAFDHIVTPELAGVINGVDRTGVPDRVQREALFMLHAALVECLHKG